MDLRVTKWEWAHLKQKGLDPFSKEAAEYLAKIRAMGIGKTKRKQTYHEIKK